MKNVKQCTAMKYKGKVRKSGRDHLRQSGQRGCLNGDI